MFKELGEFIDNVGRATGRIIGELLSDKEDAGKDSGEIHIDPDDIIGIMKPDDENRPPIAEYKDSDDDSDDSIVLKFK